MGTELLLIFHFTCFTYTMIYNCTKKCNLGICQDQGNLTSSYGSISGRIKERQIKLVWPVPDCPKQ